MMPLFDSTTLLTYAAAAAVLVLLPGPGTAWMVAQSAAGGTRHGIVAALGLESATLAHATAAGLGLSAILATSALAFEAIKFAGAAYLIVLGVKAWREARLRVVGDPGAREPSSADKRPELRDLRSRVIYSRSVVTGLLNPKVAVFFLAFLPQFVNPERGLVPVQFLVLGTILALIGFTHSCAIALAVGQLGKRLTASGRVARIRQRLIGSLFVALGLRLALQERA